MPLESLEKILSSSEGINNIDYFKAIREILEMSDCHKDNIGKKSGEIVMEYRTLLLKIIERIDWSDNTQYSQRVLVSSSIIRPDVYRDEVKEYNLLDDGVMYLVSFLEKFQDEDRTRVLIAFAKRGGFQKEDLIKIAEKAKSLGFWRYIATQ